MEDLTKQKILVNLTNSYKMASNWWFTMLGILGVIWVNMPDAQQQVVIAHLPVPGWMLPIIGTVIGIVARLWPQKSISPEVAVAKSADAPQPEEKK